MRNLSAIALAILVSAMPPAGVAKPPPAVTACPPLEEKRARLLEGKLAGFYFIDALGGNFPVPNFFSVDFPSDRGSHITVRALDPFGPYEDKTIPAAMRAAENACEWSVSIDFGPRAELKTWAGSEEQLREQAQATYQFGDLTLWVLKGSGLSTSMVATNKHGFAHVVAYPADAGYWLINLFSAIHKTP